MKREIIKFLQDFDAEIMSEWLEAQISEGHIWPAIAEPDWRDLVTRAYDQLKLHVMEETVTPGEEWLSPLRAANELAPDSILRLQNLLFRGKVIILDKISSKLKADTQAIGYLRPIEEAFSRLTSQLLSLAMGTRSGTMPSSNFGTVFDEDRPSRLNLFYNAFQYSTDGILMTDLKGNIIEVNRAFLKIFGYSRDEVIGKHTRILRSSRTTSRFYERMWNSIVARGEWKGEINNRCKNGDEIPVWLSITPLYEGDRRVGYMGIEIDMRQQKKLEERLLQTERLAVIGQMAAKVAHEIRNPLSSISLNAELLEDEIDAAGEIVSSEASTLLRSIMNEVDRVAKLTEEYLQFSRLPEADPEPGDLSRVVKDVLSFVDTEVGSAGVRLDYQQGGELPTVVFDRQQIRRTLLNLIRNATEAMPHGGVLSVALSARKGFVEMTISDTGEGVPVEKRERIFEPFYTTKDMGTGLGLAIARQIVQEHGGTITCEESEQGGARFRIQLPVARKNNHEV